MSRYYWWCAASGIVWGALGYSIGHDWLRNSVVFGGVVASPLIGIVAGAVYRPAYSMSRWKQAAFALLTLYVCASLFALAGGVLDMMVWGRMEHYIVQEDGSRGFGYRVLSSAITTPLLGTLWGLTFGGYVLFLWPMAVINHQLLRAQAERPNLPLQQTGRP